jgi:hypothetical protein
MVVTLAVFTGPVHQKEATMVSHGRYTGCIHRPGAPDRRWVVRLCNALFRAGGALLAVSFFWETPGEGQTFFTNVTREALERPNYGIRSAAFGDYDNDGYPDIFFAGGDWGFVGKEGKWWLTLLHNEGNGRFTDRYDSRRYSPQTEGGWSDLWGLR